MERKNFASRTIWEEQVGYSRAVRIGNHVFVAGTTSTDDNGVITGVKNPYRQAVQSLRNIEAALTKAGASMKDVVRTRMFITDPNNAETIGRAHNEVFKDIRPVATMVVVNRLIDREMLVEIEADAIVP
ncbi:MAG: RidA family protein [Ignavibacteriae bacterium]|nr:RidA family protein [Ignavibacteriota bacterium]